MKIDDVHSFIDEEALYVMNKTWDEVKQECEKNGYAVVLLKQRSLAHAGGEEEV